MATMATAPIAFAARFAGIAPPAAATQAAPTQLLRLRRLVAATTMESTACASRFSGKERDSETGLDYFGARYFSGAQGRFTSPDELASGVGGAYEVGGYRSIEPRPLPYADIKYPQSLNKYGYALNNPLRYIDRDGHCVDGFDTVVCVAVGVWFANRVTDVADAYSKWDEGRTFTDYAQTLQNHAVEVCSKGSSECDAAVAAAQRAQLAAMRKGGKAAKAAAQLPGTSVSGPVPTGKLDVVVGAISDVFNWFTPSFGDASTKRAADPEKDRKPTHAECLVDRSGNCIATGGK